ncbi:MAG: class I SAM-dependent methyltransferase [Geminicoccales bacterium]
MDVKNCDNLSISPWICRFSRLFSEGRTVLDLAAGAGRHSIWCLDQGFTVTAVDRATEALAARRQTDPARFSRLEIIEADLENGTSWPLSNRRFDGIIVVNYLWRPLFPSIIDALNDGGVLLYETFASGHEALGKPSNPDFLLKPGELLDVVAGRLDVIAFEQGRIEDPDRPAIKQRIAAGRTGVVTLPPP